MASSLGRLDLTEAMVDAGVDLSPAHINVGFISPLMPAVEFQNESMVRHLLDQGADINYQAKREGRHCNALRLTIKNKSESMVSLILQRGAKANARLNYAQV